MFIRSNPRFSRPHPRRLGAALLSLALVLPAPLVAQDSAAPAGPAEPSQTTAAARPDVFVWAGDNVYADRHTDATRAT